MALGYYRGLRNICHRRPEFRLLRKRCSRCRIRLLIERSNRKQAVVGCPFGCQKERRREKGNERGRRHYLTAKGRSQKRARNRNRSLVSAQESKNGRVVEDRPAVPVFRPAFLRYITYLLLLLGQKPPIPEIETLLREILTVIMGSDVERTTILRQRCLPERGG